MNKSKSDRAIGIIVAVGFVIYLIAAFIDGPFEDDYKIEKMAARAEKERASKEIDAQYDEGYQKGYNEGRKEGYNTAVKEFCFDGDPQYGGWYEGYETGKEDYKHAIFSDTEERRDFIYDFFETYCDDTEFSDYVDREYAGWRKGMSDDRALK